MQKIKGVPASRRPWPSTAEAARELLIDRIEEASAAGELRLSLISMGLLFHVLFPEDFDEGTPAEWTDFAPGGLRVDVYEERAENGESLFSKNDATVTDDIGLATRRKVGSGVAVDGWQEERFTAPKETVSQMPKADKQGPPIVNNHHVLCVCGDCVLSRKTGQKNRTVENVVRSTHERQSAKRPAHKVARVAVSRGKFAFDLYCGVDDVDGNSDRNAD